MNRLRLTGPSRRRLSRPWRPARRCRAGSAGPVVAVLVVDDLIPPVRGGPGSARAPAGGTLHPRRRPARSPAPHSREPAHPAGDPSARTLSAARHRHRRNPGQGQGRPARRPALPRDGNEELQLGVVVRGPDVLDIPRPPPRRVHDLHRRRARGRLHRPHIRQRATLRPRISAQIHSPTTRNRQVTAVGELRNLDHEPSQEAVSGRTPCQASDHRPGRPGALLRPAPLRTRYVELRINGCMSRSWLC